MDEFGDIAAVGEVGDAQRGMEIMGEYTRGDDLMQMCYAFEFLSPEAPSGRRVGAGAAQVHHRRRRRLGLLGLLQPRRRAARDALARSTPTQLRVYLALLLTLRGSVCLYQGEELGLTEAYVPFEELQDPYGKRFWPKFRGRDGCRTPMVWLADNAERRLLRRASPGCRWRSSTCAMAVSQQEDDPDSMLAFYRRMLAWRKARPALAKGSFAIGETSDSLISYVRARRRRGGLLRLQPRRRAGRRRAAGGRLAGDRGQRLRRRASSGASVELPPHQALFAERLEISG